MKVNTRRFGEEDLLLFLKGAAIDTAGLTSDGSLQRYTVLSAQTPLYTRLYASGEQSLSIRCSLIEALLPRAYAVTFETIPAA